MSDIRVRADCVASKANRSSLLTTSSSPKAGLCRHCSVCEYYMTVGCIFGGTKREFEENSHFKHDVRYMQSSVFSLKCNQNVKIKQKERSTSCLVRFCLRRKRNHLTVIPYFLEHNYKSSKFLYDRLLVNQRLIENELGTCMALLKYVAPSCEVRQFVADEFGEILTTRDTYIYRRKCRPALLSSCRIVVQLPEPIDSMWLVDESHAVSGIVRKL
ncbi:hypothetical protein CLF_100752 [Clonorchis sinensis]|uniref:Uncharacterized protein n=1 Tax=Clonorchis sinensis TaxID=79923 RepID=G7Y461_CLOSI|nr:hypothetical protein CLF_100752 [Clonorchis sinensis]